MRHPPKNSAAMSRPSRPPNIAPDQGVLVAPQVGVVQLSVERLFIYPTPVPIQTPMSAPNTYVNTPMAKQHL